MTKNGVQQQNKHNFNWNVFYMLKNIQNVNKIDFYMKIWSNK